ncbi:hypothetical protein BJ878DRAFT_177327 [Calycina marina]|uniref:RTA1 domain protein n=1 Tax=Calycina marina TaxID=1763456 RepID=A0A9P7Z8I1_9HELO|nr:hypothetical protein BJ878DRAFT_177327 [Calycina marina]
MEDGKYVDGSFYFYAPNKGAPVIFAVLFAISCGWHAWQCIRYKCWRITGILPWSALIFVAGYSLREFGAFHYDKLNVFIASLVMVYAAPPLYELSNYFTLSRILYYIPYHSPLHPGRVFTTFGLLSAIVEALNANGAAYMANSSLPKSKQDIGRALLKTALVLQLVILGIFIALALWFHRCCLKAGLMPHNLAVVLQTLYISSTLIGIRTIFRTVEFFSTIDIHYTPGTDPNTLSPLLRYEWFFYIFESSLMVLNTYLLNFRHTMRYLPRDNAIYLAEDGVTQVQGPGYQDKRLWLVTVVDPFDLHGLLRGRNLKERFWETHKDERKGGGEVKSVLQPTDGAEAEPGRK